MKKIFIASRFEEFREIREKLRKELLDCNLYPIDLNDNNTVSHPPLSRSLQSVRESDIVILGFPDDEGIALNGGRPGAQNAPREIRTYLYKMTPHLESTSLPKILDLGDISDKEKDLPARHEKARETVRTLAMAKKPSRRR